MKINRRWKLEERVLEITEEYERFAKAREDYARISNECHVAMYAKERKSRLKALSEELG